MKKLHQISLTSVMVTAMAITPTITLASNYQPMLGSQPQAQPTMTASQKSAHEQRLDFLAKLYGISKEHVVAELRSNQGT